jgi:hypothetical protein
MCRERFRLGCGGVPHPGAPISIPPAQHGGSSYMEDTFMFKSYIIDL